MPQATMPIFRNEDDLAKLPASERIRYRLVGADCRYHANDNISAFVREGELEELKAEVQAHMHKVLKSLARAGLLAAHRGVTGGYELTARARQASVLDVVEAVNGLPMLNTCVLAGGCHRAPTCPAHPVWHQAQERMREVLGGSRLADLAGNDRAAPPAAGRPARRTRAIQVLRERPCVEHGIRQPGRASRRPRPTYPKRMEDR